MFRYDFDGRKRLASETLSAYIITQRYTEVSRENGSCVQLLTTAPIPPIPLIY